MRTMAERFEAKVDRSGGSDACWSWTAYLMPNGYGQIGLGGRGAGFEYAHRMAWRLAFGDIPDGLCVCHTCDVRNCVNPSHLFVGTQGDNLRDMHRKGRGGQIGERHSKARLTVDAVREIRVWHRAGFIDRIIAAEYGVSRRHINDVTRGVEWRHVKESNG